LGGRFIVHTRESVSREAFESGVVFICACHWLYRQQKKNFISI